MVTELIKTTGEPQRMSAVKKEQLPCTWMIGREMLGFITNTLSVHERMVAALLDVTTKSLENWLDVDARSATRKFQRLQALYEVIRLANRLDVPSQWVLQNLHAPIPGDYESQSILNYIREHVQLNTVLALAHAQFKEYQPNCDQSRLNDQSPKALFRKEYGPLNEENILEVAETNFQILMDIVNSEDVTPPARALCIKGLGHAEDPKSLDLIFSVLENKENPRIVRRAAVDALYSFVYHENSKDLIRERLAKMSDSSPGIAKMINKILGE